jgi:hypothetical protein
MAAKDMTDALQNPHPEVPFASVRDDTIMALTDLAAIYKLKLQQFPSPANQAAPAKPRSNIKPHLELAHALELFPHNYQMPKLSSTNQLLIAAKDMTDALQNPHPEVPFASVGDDTISALADLAAIFKLKLRQAPSPATQASSAKVVPRPSIAPS